MSDIMSKWIWTKDWDALSDSEAKIVLFRREIDITRDIVSALIKISADTKYKLYVNGTFVEFGPSRGDKKIWFYDEVDLKSFLTVGSNVISVIVLRYPEDYKKGNHGMFRTHTPGLYIEGSVKFSDGDSESLDTDGRWQCKVDERVSFIREEERFAPLIIHEDVKGNEGYYRWMTSGFRDDSWRSAVNYPIPLVEDVIREDSLHKRTIPFLYKKKRRFKSVMTVRKSIYSDRDWLDFLRGDRALTIPKHSEEIIEIDAGEEMTGFINLSFSRGHLAKIKLLYSECYVQDGFEGPEQHPIKKDRLDYENGHLTGYEDNYLVYGKTDREEYSPFWFRTFRFIRLHICTSDEELTLENLDYDETGYPLEVKTEVRTSDTSLDDIWNISERTLRRCMHESYEDCPFYEQLQYIMDTRAQILYTYSVSSDDRLARKCIEDFRRAQRYDGLLNCSYPNTNINVIPGFSIYYILMVYDHMMYFGDKALIRDSLPTIEGILNFFDRNLNDDGLVGKIGGVNGKSPYWSFIDWASEWMETMGMPSAGLSGPITMESLLYVYGLQISAKLYAYIGRMQYSEMLLERALKVQRAIIENCTGDNGMLRDGPNVCEYSQHCQVFAVLTGTGDKEILRSNLLRTIEEEGFTQCTVAMRFYLFRALEMTDLYAYTDKYWNAWRKMVRDNCTTCVESESYARSECHAWGALILYELPSTTLGVRPLSPSYEKVQIKPIQGYLSHASGKVNTPRGDIEVSWRMVDGDMKIEYSVPEGISVETV